MKDIFLSELRRFHRLALAVAIAHLLLLLFVNRMADLFQMSYFETFPFFAVYLLTGLVLAVLQIGSYRKPSQWAWLMHRPLSPERIFAALALSALTLLVITMLLPMLLLVLGTDFFTTRVVDTRHYLALFHLLAVAMLAWLAGAHASVSRSKFAIALLAAPVLLAVHLVSAWVLLIPMLIALSWLCWITMRSFRANREAPIEGSFTLVMTALPIQLGIFLLVFELGQFLFVTGGILFGVDPLNTESPPEGGLIAMMRAKPADEMQMSLEGSTHPRAESWRQQMPLMEPVRIGPHLDRFPIRHQPGNLKRPSQWVDETNRVQWTFSHDHMLFKGRDQGSGADRGWWGVKGAGDMQPFEHIPVMSEPGYLLTRDAVYAIDKEAQRQHELLRLPEGEQLVAVPREAFNRLLVLTNERLIAYREDRQSVSKYAPLLVDWEIALPRGPVYLEFATVTELMDGWLVATLYGDGTRNIAFNYFNTVAYPWQQVMHVDDSGTIEIVNERNLQRDYPALYQVGWWFSPPLHILSELPDVMLDKQLTWPIRFEPVPRVPVFHTVAAALMLLSFALAWWWLSETRANAARRRVWLVSCVLFGLPAFVTLVLLEPRIPVSEKAGAAS